MILQNRQDAREVMIFQEEKAGRDQRAAMRHDIRCEPAGGRDPRAPEDRCRILCDRRTSPILTLVDVRAGMR